MTSGIFILSESWDAARWLNDSEDNLSAFSVQLFAMPSLGNVED